MSAPGTAPALTGWPHWGQNALPLEEQCHNIDNTSSISFSVFPIAEIPFYQYTSLLPLVQGALGKTLFSVGGCNSYKYALK